MLAWWACQNASQELIDINTVFDIEHIYAKNRTPQVKNIEKLGNKSLLEDGINIRASDYRFEDKKKYYQGYTKGNGQTRKGSKIAELQQLCSMDGFNEEDILDRNSKIIDGFIEFLANNNLIKDNE
jgi:hypothetical protein